MRVLLVHNHYRPPSGENVVFENEKQLLLDNGIEIVTYERSNQETDGFSRLKKASLALSVPWSIRSYRDISAIIREHKPEVAHFHNVFPLISPSGFKACQDHGVPVVQTLHNYRWVCPGAMLVRDGEPCEKCLSGNLLPALRHRCYRDSSLETAFVCGMLLSKRHSERKKSLVDGYIALTEFAAGRLARGGIPEGKTTIKPNFLPAQPPPNLDGREHYAVYAGLLSKEKGLPTLLEAWKSLDSLPLKIIGEGPLHQDLKKWAASQHLNAEFLGYLSHAEVLRITGKALLRIVPSELYENFPMAVLEAYSTGTPVVASRIGCLAEIVADQESGLLFQPGNPAQLVDMVKLLLGDERLRRSLARTGLTMFATRYASEANFKVLVDIYKRVIESSRGAIQRLA